MKKKWTCNICEKDGDCLLQKHDEAEHCEGVYKKENKQEE